MQPTFMSDARGDAPPLRPLSPTEEALVAQAAEKARILYEGARTPHRSCGIALAETFGLPTRPYQALRRGGLLGEGECGAIKAGELILGELLGDPDPTGPARPELRAALEVYRRLWRARADLGPGGASGSIVCNTLTAPQGDFRGEGRHRFCTSLAETAARAVAEALVRAGVRLEVTPIAGLDPGGGP